MKVAMIVHAYYLKDARVRRYAEALARRGDEVHVICLRESNEAIFEEHLGVAIHRINVSHRRGGMLSYFVEYLSSFVGFFRKLNMLYLKGHRYQLIHIHNFPNFLVFAAAIQKILGAKILLDIHDPMPEVFCSKYRVKENHPLIKFLNIEERISIWYADLVVAANHAFKDLLTQRSCPSRKIEVILNAPDDKFWVNDLQKIKPRPDSFNILYVGTLSERYGVETALQAVASVKKSGIIPKITLSLIPKIQNEGEYARQLIQEVHRLDLEDNFELLEPVPLDEMPDVIRRADVSVYTPLPDIHMGIALSLKIPEIIAVGRPLVTSRLPVLQRYFGEDALFMFEPGNVEECATKLVEVYRNPGEAQSRVQKAQAALRKFAWETQRSTYFSVIDDALNGKRPVKGHARSGANPSFKMRLKKVLRRAITLLTHYTGLSVAWRWVVARHGVRILAYHGVELAPSNSFAVSRSNFEEQMRYVRAESNVISLPQYLRSLTSGLPLPSNTVILTFDDGFQNFYEFAYPILKKYQLPATCFVIISKVESTDGDFMHWRELRELIDGGLVSIGSHTVSHRSISNLDESELNREIVRSKYILEKGLGILVDCFSYPYGTTRDYNQRCAEVISHVGYGLACTSVNGPNWRRTNPHELRRTKIQWGDDLPTFKRILKGAIDIWVLADYCLPFLQGKGERNFSPAQENEGHL